MTDIVKRLEAWADMIGTEPILGVTVRKDLREAADEIEALRARVAELTEQLIVQQKRAEAAECAKVPNLMSQKQMRVP